jgi:shikimate dehydrogenase
MIDARTRLVTLFGYPIAHSLSPLIHNTAFRAQGLNFVYVTAPVRPAELPAAVAGLRALRCAGSNVTIPHKAAVAGLVDDLSPQARAVGAVNTIVCRGLDDDAPVSLYGDNTDVQGFLEPLAPHRDGLEGGRLVIFGAGGAARAVAYALLTACRPERLTLVARTTGKAERLAADLSPYDPTGALQVMPVAEARAAVRAGRLLVNATPLGMHPDEHATPWPTLGDFGPEQVVYDLVYNPERTRLLVEAGSHGAGCIGGLAMLIGQADAAYRQWTGRPMPVEAVRDALRARS